jgi:hypothetical protein
VRSLEPLRYRIRCLRCAGDRMAEKRQRKGEAVTTKRRHFVRRIPDPYWVAVCLWCGAEYRSIAPVESLARDQRGWERHGQLKLF